ncbi:hypothetical protein [Komagataeibacter xylinus]|uniref:hypothetical protein n=1 Tax=Komagataeibacter xylinus TaxID=28448 RepID=UPI000AD68E54|nr:hypothetical protein [Komagataeibacter xylinus]
MKLFSKCFKERRLFEKGRHPETSSGVVVEKMMDRKISFFVSMLFFVRHPVACRHPK